MTLRQAYEEGIEKLKEAGIEEAGLDAWYLLEYVTGINRATYFADSNQEMKDSHRATYQTLISERETRIPLQHLTGVQEFMGLEFRVNEHVLIPRQDTEILVETALEKINTKKPLRVLDMCTGSGCILLSVLSYGRKKCEITGVGVDVSDKALQVAKENARILQVDAEWIESDLFSGVSEKFDMILSNPPYIPSAVIKTLQPEVREHDPLLALDGKEDGLYFYRKIIEESRNYLQPGGWLIFEIGAEQGEAVSSYLKQNGFVQVAVKKDLTGLDRVVCGVYDTCEG